MLTDVLARVLGRHLHPAEERHLVEHSAVKRILVEDEDVPGNLAHRCREPLHDLAQHRLAERVEEVEGDRLERELETHGVAEPELKALGRACSRHEASESHLGGLVQLRRELDPDEAFERVVRGEEQGPSLPGAEVDEDVRVGRDLHGA